MSHSLSLAILNVNNKKCHEFESKMDRRKQDMEKRGPEYRKTLEMESRRNALLYTFKTELLRVVLLNN